MPSQFQRYLIIKQIGRHLVTDLKIGICLSLSLVTCISKIWPIGQLHSQFRRCIPQRLLKNKLAVSRIVICTIAYLLALPNELPKQIGSPWLRMAAPHLVGYDKYNDIGYSPNSRILYNGFPDTYPAIAHWIIGPFFRRLPVLALPDLPLGVDPRCHPNSRRARRISRATSRSCPS